MAYTYTPSQTASNKVDKASIGLQISHMLYTIVTIFASTFLISDIVSVNAENPLSQSITTIAIYYITQFIVFCVSYFLMSFIVDKTGRVWIYRLGILLYGAFIIMVIFVGKELSKFIVLAGALYGLSEGVFHSAYNVLKCEMVPRRSMRSYSTWSFVFDKLTKTVFPILLGVLIDSSTFSKTAIFVLVLIAVQFGVTFMIKSQRPDQSSFDFFKYLKSLKNNTQDMKRIKSVYKVSWFYGFKTIFATLFSIVTIYTFKTNVKLGIFTSISSVVSIVTLLLFKRFTKEGKRTSIYLISSILFVISTIILVIFMNTWTYVIYNLVDAVCLNIFANGFDIERNLVIKKVGHYNDIAEHNCVVEILFTISRLIAYSIMLVLGLTLDLLGLKICIVVCALLMPVMCMLTDKIEKVECQYSLENIENNSCSCDETEKTTEEIAKNSNLSNESKK